jgi:hypothetical protein
MMNDLKWMGLTEEATKGCMTKLAAKAKQNIPKHINRRVEKTHGKMIFAGWDPECTKADGEKVREEK